MSGNCDEINMSKILIGKFTLTATSTNSVITFVHRNTLLDYKRIVVKRNDANSPDILVGVFPENTDLIINEETITERRRELEMKSIGNNIDQLLNLLNKKNPNSNSLLNGNLDKQTNQEDIFLKFQQQSQTNKNITDKNKDEIMEQFLSSLKQK